MIDTKLTRSLIPEIGGRRGETDPVSRDCFFFDVEGDVGCCGVEQELAETY